MSLICMVLLTDQSYDIEIWGSEKKGFRDEMVTRMGLQSENEGRNRPLSALSVKSLVSERERKIFFSFLEIASLLSSLLSLV